MILLQELLDIYLKVLKYYSEKIREFGTDEDLPVNPFIKNDLNDSATRIDLLISEMKKNGLFTNLQFGYKFTDNPEYKQLLCHALKCYSDDLTRSKDSVKGKLGEYAEDVKFEFTDMEIKDILTVYNELCKPKSLSYQV